MDPIIQALAWLNEAQDLRDQAAELTRQAKRLLWRHWRAEARRAVDEDTGPLSAPGDLPVAHGALTATHRRAVEMNPPAELLAGLPCASEVQWEAGPEVAHEDELPKTLTHGFTPRPGGCPTCRDDEPDA